MTSPSLLTAKRPLTKRKKFTPLSYHHHKVITEAFSMNSQREKQEKTHISV
jgi:hypothetical protein